MGVVVRETSTGEGTGTFDEGVVRVGLFATKSLK